MDHINKFSLENFRVFENKQEFELRPITIITGQNNSGKSSLLKALQMLKDTSSNADFYNTIDSEQFDFSESLFDKKKSLKIELSYLPSLEIMDPFFAEWDNLKLNQNQFIYVIKLSYKIDGRLEKIETGIEFISKTYYPILSVDVFGGYGGKFSTDKIKINYDFIYSTLDVNLSNVTIDLIKKGKKNKDLVRIPNVIQRGHPEEVFLQLDHIIANFSVQNPKKEESTEFININTDEDGEYQKDIEHLYNIDFPFQGKEEWKSVFGAFSIIKTNLSIITDRTTTADPSNEILIWWLQSYIGSINNHLSTPSSFSVIDKKLINSRAFTKDNPLYQIFSEFKDLSNGMDKLKKWLLYFEIGDNIEIKVIEQTVVVVYIISNGVKRNINDLGSGYLRIINLLMRCISVVTLEADGFVFRAKRATIIIEEPELNLHPNLQSKLADFFVTILKENYALELIIETHSEYFIRRLQFLTAKGEISPLKSIIHYINKVDSIDDLGIKPAQVVPITILKDGRLSQGFGTGFMDESSKLMASLLTGENLN